MAGLTVCDASALIAWLDPDDAHHERSATLISDALEGTLGASTLTLAEVLVGPYRAGREKDVQRALEAIGLSEISLEGRAGELASIRSQTDLRLPDCCVLLAAEVGEAGLILTFDHRLARAAAGRGVRVAS